MKVFEYRGVRDLLVAEVLTDNAEEITFGTPFPLLALGELGRTTATSSDVHYYDNVPALVIDSTGSDEVTISGSGIPYKELAKVTGQYYDEDLGMLVEGERDSKYFAIGYITKRTDGTEVFVWRLKGTFSIPDSKNKTEDNGTDSNGDGIKFTGINTRHKFSKTKKTAKSVQVETDVNPLKETDFFSQVQTPDTVRKASELSA